MGKTNPAKLASDFQSTNDLFGRVNNPWNLNCTSGGSSGGTAAAVAAGLSPLDLGSDIAGSIRQPSHFCGVFGLKPTDRRISTMGHIPEVPGMIKCIRQMLTVGPLARSIEDLRLCLQLIAGADLRQPDIPPVPLDTPTTLSLQALRIAWTDEFPAFPVAEDIRLTMQAVANSLVQTGVQIEPWVPPGFDFAAALRLYNRVVAYTLLYAQAVDLDTVQEMIPVMYREWTQGDKELQSLYKVTGVLPTFLNPTMKGYFQALAERDRLIAQMEQALEQWDVWLCPVAMTPAFTHRPKGEAVEVDGKKVPYFLASGAYTMPFNLTGHPVVVIPIGQTKNGLPIGMQIIGKRWREIELLAIAEVLTQAIRGFQHPSGY